MAAPAFGDRVFLNVPFDRRYKSLFEALIFAVHDCGLVARCALEGDDGSVVRLDKIFEIISECRYGIHDLSRTTLDAANHLPRFNMPLELGVFLGAKRFGNAKQRSKSCLILDRDPGWRDADNRSRHAAVARCGERDTWGARRSRW